MLCLLAQVDGDSHVFILLWDGQKQAGLHLGTVELGYVPRLSEDDWLFPLLFPTLAKQLELLVQSMLFPTSAVQEFLVPSRDA